MTAPSGVPSAALARLADRLWLISPAEADYAAAEMRCYDAAVAMTLGPTVHVWPAARGVLGTPWPAVHSMLLVEQKANAALKISDWAYVMIGGHVGRSCQAAEVLTDPAMGELFPGGGTRLAEGTEVIK